MVRWSHSARRALALSGLLAGCGAAAQATTPRTSPTIAVAEAASAEARRARLGTILDELSRPPFGSGAGLTYSIGERTETHVAGVAFDGGPPITPETPFNVASVSKVVTAAIVLSLIGENRLALDTPLSRHLPGVTLSSTAGPVDVTIEQLLGHRAGLPHQPPNLDPSTFGSSWTDPLLLQRLTGSWTVELIAAPGEYHYSNLGYALLAAVIERVHDGEGSFAETARSYLDRFGMLEATFWSADLENGAHGRIEEGGEVHFNAPPWYGSRYGLPFTGLWSSMPDLHRFGHALLAAHRDPEHALHPMARPLEAGEGFVTTRRTRGGEASIEHDGSGPGFLAWVIVVPAHDLVIAVACNGGGESRATGERFFEITDEIVDTLVAR